MEPWELLDLLGNENRRKILQLLASRPCYVSEISGRLRVAPKAVLDHLAMLEEAGIIEARAEEGRRKYFQISESVHLSVELGPFSFGTEASPVEEEDLDDDHLRRAAQRLEEVERLESRDRLGDLTLALRGVRDLQAELAGAYRSLQWRANAIMERCQEAVRGLTGDPREVAILLALARGMESAREVYRSVGLEYEEFLEVLQGLQRGKLITVSGDKIRLEGVPPMKAAEASR
ncbi:MAG: ArsR family transcriptional regulator [Euryarchaeota archaeon]|nr:ArsR family transcriptional regulator [Euryarchaeota archaeon]